MQSNPESTIARLANAGAAANLVELADADYSSLDAGKLDRVRRLLLDGVEQLKPRDLVVDLSKVQYFGAGFIGILVETWRQLRERERKLVLCGLTPYCRKLLRTLCLDKVISIYPTREIALKTIGRQVSSGSEAARRPQVFVRKSDVAWDSNMVCLEYLGDDGTHIRSIIAPREHSTD
jgi:anti-anti-sigma factor